MQFSYNNQVLTLYLTGRLDAVSAPAAETEIGEILEKNPTDTIILDCDGMEYCSSAGLRVILRLKQKVDGTSLVNVHPVLYEILDTTGFTEMMEVKKAFRLLSLDGCELIGQGANGRIFRMDSEHIMKVYTNTDSLAEIDHERELSRAAFVLGVPTAIPYDVVKVREGGYGSIYELLNAKTYAQLLTGGEKTPDELVRMSIDLLKLIHSRIVKQAFIPSIRETALGWALYLKDWLPAEQFEKLYALIEAVPEDMHMIHGDFHFRNIMYQNGECLLIDMDKLSHGHPVFDLAFIYNAYCGFGLTDPSGVEKFLDIPYETAGELWRRHLARYLDTADEARLRDVEDRVRIVSHLRLMRHFLRRNGMSTEAGRRKIDASRAALEELLPRVDTLLF